MKKRWKVSLLILPVLLLLCLPIYCSWKIERTARALVIGEMEQLLPDVHFRFLKGSPGEGNDSFMEYSFSAEVFSDRDTTVTFHHFDMALKAGRKYIVNGIAYFSGAPGDTDWRMDSMSFVRLEAADGR